ncbi:hypothetical protein Moror_11486 [Moniliophthora roreri MCA 2997]|uniref:Uncharacterized protein n=1 Tax=Moniliophthora roreri (strain MCA 2997) TaxID=1381753 RepID=V2WR30_MONRO|nr:hypothetical protein Moror_11486 [Moniliophthora roreri MCA 2997]
MLDGETYNLTYKADINTDQSESWLSVHESDEETEHYLFNDHLNYGINNLANLAQIKQEFAAADSTLLQTPSACMPSPSATPMQPSPLQTPTLLPTPL